VIEELPFCWYFGVQNAEQPEKRVEFLGKEERETFDIDHYPDPQTNMIGFIMRNPRVFNYNIVLINRNSMNLEAKFTINILPKQRIRKIRPI